MVIPVARAYEVPVTMEGKALFNIQNCLAATAATYAAGLKIEEIRQGLTSFFPSPMQVPGRTNLIPVKNFRVLLDYAHNPHAYRNLLSLVKSLEHPRRTIILDAVGDRRDEDIVELGRLAGPVFDRVILYEDKELRGRKSGEIVALLRKGLVESGMKEENIEIALPEVEAIDRGLALCEEKDLLCIMTGRVQAAIQHIYDYKEKAENILHTGMKETGC